MRQWEPVWQKSVKHFLVIHLLKPVTFSLQLIQQNSFIKMLSKAFHQHSPKRRFVELCMCSRPGSDGMKWNSLGRWPVPNQPGLEYICNHQKRTTDKMWLSEDPWNQPLSPFHSTAGLPQLKVYIKEYKDNVSNFSSLPLHSSEHAKYNTGWEI